MHILSYITSKSCTHYLTDCTCITQHVHFAYCTESGCHSNIETFIPIDFPHALLCPLPTTEDVLKCTYSIWMNASLPLPPEGGRRLCIHLCLHVYYLVKNIFHQVCFSPWSVCLSVIHMIFGHSFQEIVLNFFVGCKRLAKDSNTILVKIQIRMRSLFNF